MTNILNAYIYNQHFVAMMNIINKARLNPPSKGHNHHIIPKCWFKLHNLPVDNSKDNLVLLTEEDHQKVHRLCVLCVKDEPMKSKMIFAVHRLHGSMCGLHHTEDTKKKISTNNARYWKGKVPPASLVNKGRILTEEHRIKLSEAHKGKSWKLVNGKRVYTVGK
jgi:hypothetical protein